MLQPAPDERGTRRVERTRRQRRADRRGRAGGRVPAKRAVQAAAAARGEGGGAWRRCVRGHCSRTARGWQRMHAAAVCAQGGGGWRRSRERILVSAQDEGGHRARPPSRTAQAPLRGQARFSRSSARLSRVAPWLSQAVPATAEPIGADGGGLGGAALGRRVSAALRSGAAKYRPVPVSAVAAGFVSFRVTARQSRFVSLCVSFRALLAASD